MRFAKPIVIFDLLIFDFFRFIGIAVFRDFDIPLLRYLEISIFRYCGI